MSITKGKILFHCASLCTIYSKLMKTLSFLACNKRNSGRSWSAATYKNVEMLRILLKNNSKVSALRNGFGLSASSNSNCITHNSLTWYTNQICTGHQLIECDFQKRSDSTHWIIYTCQNNRFLVFNVVIGHKSIFLHELHS